MVISGGYLDLYWFWAVCTFSIFDQQAPAPHLLLTRNLLLLVPIE
jgi:hypothetical protein